VPYARRQELRAELRGHLEALVSTHEELGSARDAAVVLALRQFGPPRHLSRQWAHEWTRDIAPVGLRPLWQATRIALASFGAAALLALALMAAFIGSAVGEIGTYTIVGMVALLLPALAGLSTGLRAPARPAMGAFFALALLTLPTAALALHALAQPGPGADQALSLGLAMAQPLWIPIGCGAAALGGSLRTRLSLRPRKWLLQ
jgi:hypothetical protein